ncbi:hypothetical protein [Brevibacillus choshinensis]|uniref:DUF4025 domain-containing protein n=1 Tax=Brevibacillus choshinensis TaxID=54911 RepID=A0ABX7FK11_BRECH|nr:hypothetical protein [Brevibacillus choshinensis]QRG66556.1 hypothetical protein JNE38_24040 [Brevibacillus choshinensis]
MTDRTTNQKPDMGYHGSNMHGYSISKKGEALDETAKAVEENKENGEEHPD